MKNLSPKILFLFLTALIILSSCSDGDGPKVNEEIYPITLKFKKEGDSKLEYWKGGVLTDKPASEYTDYFDQDNCLGYFDSETDPFCKSTTITFTSETDLTFEYDQNSFALKYQIINDTLKVQIDSDLKALGAGNKQQLKIYGSLYKYSLSTQSGCGGDEFHKNDFDGQFFINASPNHSLPITEPSQMNPDDEIVFYNREYILGK